MARGAGGLWSSIRALWISLRFSLLQRRDSLDHTVRRHFQAGVRAINESRWAEAEASVSRGLARQDRHFLAHLYLGVAIYHQGRHKEAHAAMVRAQSLDPKRFSVYRAASNLPGTDPPSQPEGDLLGDLVKNLEQCAIELRETAEKIHDASRRQQRAIKRFKVSKPRRGLAAAGRRRRGKARKPRVSAFSKSKEAKKFREMSPITKDDATNVNWDEVIARILK